MRLKWLVCLSCFFLLLVGLGLGGAYWWLNTDSGSEFILSKAKEILPREYGVKFHYAEGKVKLFSGIYFKDLSIEWEKNQQKLSMRMDGLKADYSFSFFGKSLTLNHVEVLHPVLYFSSHAPAQADEIPAGQGAPAGEARAPFPYTFFVKQALLTQGEFDVTVIRQGKTVAAQAKNVEFQSELEGSDHQVHTAGKWSSGTGVRVTLQQEKAKPISMQFDLSGKWLVDLIRAAGNAQEAWRANAFEVEALGSTKNFKWGSAHSGIAIEEQKLEVKSVGNSSTLNTAHGPEFEFKVNYLAKGVQLPALPNGLKKTDWNLSSVIKISTSESSSRTTVTELNSKIALKPIVVRHVLKLADPAQPLGNLSGEIELDAPVLSIPTSVRALSKQLAHVVNTQAQASFTLKNKRDLSVDTFLFSMNGGELKIEGDLAGDLLSKDFQSNSNTTILLKDKLNGKIEIPITASLLAGKNISLKGEVELEKMNWAEGVYAVRGVNGVIPFEEKMNWENGAFSFSSLIVQNPFERVNFERLRPLLEGQGSEPLNIEALQWKEKTYGPFVGYFSMRQNMILAHQFDLDVGAGRISGELFFDAYPKNLQVGILSRITGINLAEVLPQQYLSRMPSGNKNVSGRSGLVMNMNKGTLDGRVDITEIGGPQLITFINILDPTYEDEKMNRMRTVLGVAYPKNVSLAFAEGFMDMDIELVALGVKQTERLHGFPISGLISRNKIGK